MTANPSFKSAEIHKTPAAPSELFEIAPPQRAPIRRRIGAASLRFLSALTQSPSNSAASENKSQYILVRTTLVKALYFNARLTTACPQLWNAIRAMGTIVFQGTSSDAPSPGRTVKIIAAAMMKIIWRANERQRTHLCFGLGENFRWKRLKAKEPMQKAKMEIPDFFHRLVPAVSPRPKYTVFPAYA